MSERLSKFTILRYVPDEYREEFINIGLVMHVPEERSIMCKLTTNYSRIKAFDNEVDLDFLRIILDGVYDQFNLRTDSGPSLAKLAQENFLYECTRHYVNQLQFSDIKTIYPQNWRMVFDDLFRTYVKSDPN